MASLIGFHVEDRCYDTAIEIEARTPGSRPGDSAKAVAYSPGLSFGKARIIAPMRRHVNAIAEHAGLRHTLFSVRRRERCVSDIRMIVRPQDTSTSSSKSR
jgi:hypothetical protein